MVETGGQGGDQSYARGGGGQGTGAGRDAGAKVWLRALEAVCLVQDRATPWTRHCDHGLRLRDLRGGGEQGGRCVAGAGDGEDESVTHGRERFCGFRARSERSREDLDPRIEPFDGERRVTVGTQPDRDPPLLHVPERPTDRRGERVDACAVGLPHEPRRVDAAREHDEGPEPARGRTGRDGHGGSYVGGTIGARSRRRSHRAGEHDRGVAVVQQVAQEGDLLEEIGAVRDDDRRAGGGDLDGAAAHPERVRRREVDARRDLHDLGLDLPGHLLSEILDHAGRRPRGRPRHRDGPARDEQAHSTIRSSLRRQSGRADSNRRPPAPKAGALPGCATPRCGCTLGAASDHRPNRVRTTIAYSPTMPTCRSLSR